MASDDVVEDDSAKPVRPEVSLLGATLSELVRDHPLWRDVVIPTLRGGMFASSGRLVPAWRVLAEGIARRAEVKGYKKPLVSPWLQRIAGKLVDADEITRVLNMRCVTKAVRAAVLPLVVALLADREPPAESIQALKDSVKVLQDANRGREATLLSEIAGRVEGL